MKLVEFLALASVVIFILLVIFGQGILTEVIKYWTSHDNVKGILEGATVLWMLA